MSFDVAVEMQGGRWKRYPAYKDSGVEWLEEVPEEWTVKRLRFLFQFLDNYRIPVAGEDRAAMTKIFPYYGASGIIDYVDDYIFDETLILVAEDGANLLSRSSPLAFIATGKYWVNNHAHILRPISGQLLFWEGVLQTYDYSPLITGAAQPKLTKENLGSILLPCPPIDEQRAIAAFLDRETGRIDTLITKKERQVELLQEKRAALISHAVTKGLDPDVKMKDSGVEWIGKIPEHWTLLPMKRNWQITDCKHKTVSFIDDGIPVASIGEVKTIDVNLVNAKMTTHEGYKELIGGGRKPKKGDIIYSRNATVGAAAFVNNDVDFCMGQDVCLISSKINNQRFLIHQLLSPVVINQLESLYVGATFKRINVDQIKNFLIVCPSPKEQEVIAIYCDKISQRADILSTKLNESISKLREYRTALISSAVTGKIDVREGV